MLFCYLTLMCVRVFLYSWKYVCLSTTIKAGNNNHIDNPKIYRRLLPFWQDNRPRNFEIAHIWQHLQRFSSSLNTLALRFRGFCFIHFNCVIIEMAFVNKIKLTFFKRWTMTQHLRFNTDDPAPYSSIISNSIQSLNFTVH